MAKRERKPPRLSEREKKQQAADVRDALKVKGDALLDDIEQLLTFSFGEPSAENST